MSIEAATAALLIAVPIAFNLAFFELGRTFDYPGILREPPDVILRRFAAGGTPLLLRWQALLLSALAMLPLVALLASALHATQALTIASVAIGSAAALVQALGLVRWPFVVPELARRYVAAEGPEAAPTRQAIEVTFATLHRLLGVGIGEHLGYLLTGLWTILVAASIVSTTAVAAMARMGWSPDRPRAPIRKPRVRRTAREGRLAGGRDHRADCLRRLVALADRARDRPDRLSGVAGRLATQKVVETACDAPSSIDAEAASMISRTCRACSAVNTGASSPRRTAMKCAGPISTRSSGSSGGGGWIPCVQPSRPSGTVVVDIDARPHVPVVLGTRPES